MRAALSVHLAAGCRLGAQVRELCNLCQCETGRKTKDTPLLQTHLGLPRGVPALLALTPKADRDPASPHARFSRKQPSGTHLTERL